MPNCSVPLYQFYHTQCCIPHMGKRLCGLLMAISTTLIGPEHAPLFAVAAATLLFLWLPYTLFLLLGQWLHRFNCRLITRMLMKMKPFVDAYSAPFKDKHRYWFGALLIVRAAILLASGVFYRLIRCIIASLGTECLSQ